MARIGLFGGTFDPPHTGHIELAKKVLKDFNLSKIIFIPAGNPPHKQDKKKTDKIHRYRMVELATKSVPEFIVSDFDIKNVRPNYSYITIEHFKEEYPDSEIFFIIGADSFRDLPLWKNYRQLLTMCHFIVVSRPDVEKGEYYEKYKGDEPYTSVFFIEDFSYDISSTTLREQIPKGTFDERHLPDGVLQYIKDNNLYPKESL